MPLPRYDDEPLAGMLDQAGRSVVVTGAGRGIGFAIARRFAEAGASVVLADLDGDGAARAAEQLSDLDGNAMGVAFDATDPTAHEELAERAVAEQGGLDVWVNNAGIYPFTGLLDLEDAEWRRVLALNLDGVFWGCRAAGRAMRDLGSGCIINMSSTAGYRAGGPGLAHYTTAKHGVIGLTKKGPPSQCSRLRPCLVSRREPASITRALTLRCGRGSPVTLPAWTISTGCGGAMGSAARGAPA